MPRGSAPGERRGGRQKGTPNKTTQALKDAILEAARLAGDAEGLVGYLKAQAILNPAPFMSLLGRVLPLQVAGDPDNPLLEKITTIERVIVAATDTASAGQATDTDARDIPTAH